MDGVIRHEYFYPDGPETVEHLLASSEHCETNSPWIQALRGQSSADIRKMLKSRFEKLNEAPLSTFSTRLLECAPKSLVTFEESSWLLLALGDVSALSDFGNMVMLPAPNDSPFEMINDSICRAFLREFAGMCNTIPPSNGFFWPDQIPNFVISETSDLHGYVPDEWRNSVGFYHPGNGDLLAIRPDGIVGLWCHELVHSSEVESPFTPIADSFADIIPELMAHLFDGAYNNFGPSPVLE